MRVDLLMFNGFRQFLTSAVGIGCVWSGVLQDGMLPDDEKLF